MSFSNYNELLKPSDIDNFRVSLDKPNGYTFNSLLNILNDEKVKYKVLDGYNMNSKDSDISEFNKITIRFSSQKQIDNIFKEYSLEEVFNITKDKKTYTFITLE